MFYPIIAGIIVGASLLWGALSIAEPNLGATIAYPPVGGTGTSTLPTAGDILMSWGGSVYGPTGLIAGSNITISTSTYRQVTISSTASGSGDPFTHTSVYGQTTSATSTLLSLTGSPFSLVASSTVNFVLASTTYQTVFNNLYLPNIATFQLLQTDANKIVSATTSIGWNLITGGPSGANPTASVGLSAVNGTALTFLRSDGAPALNQAIAPTWTGLHTFTNSGTTTFAGGLYGTRVAAPYFNATSTTATSTFRGGVKINNGGLSVDNLSSALALFTSSGVVTEYSGIDCTNQFVRDVGADGAGTCETVGTSDVASGITLDTEWDTEGEVQTAWGGVNILLETEIDASSELATLMDDETGTGLLVFNSAPAFVGGTTTFAGGLYSNLLAAPYFIATSSTATSTFGGGIKITGGGLGILSLNASNCDLKADTSGNIYCGTDSTESGSWPFDTTAWNGAVAAGTSTAYRNTNIIVASTTFFTQASTTMLTNTGNTYFTAITSALGLFGAGGLLEEYTGTSCTNQFVRSLNGAGVATCAAVSLTADVTGTLPIANGGTNATSFTSGKPIAFDGTSLISTSTLAVNVGGTGSTTLSSTLLVGAGVGVIDSYDGTSCTNQFVRSLNGAGVATCETVGTADVASGITLDTEWDTESEVQTAWGSVNILLETEIDASSELATLMDDETGSGLLVFNSAPAFVGGTTTFAGGVYSNIFAAPYFNATSTTATSTFRGGIKINGGLDVDGLSAGSCDVKANGGVLSCGSDAQGSGAWPFTTSDINFGVGPPLQSTTTVEWFKGNGTWGLFASSTSVFDQATTTRLTILDGIYLAGSRITDFIADATIDLVNGALRVVDLICTDCLNATEIEDIFLFNSGDVGTGAYDFGGATDFEIPNSANPTVNASGEIAIDTTAASTSLRFYDGTAERYLYETKPRTFYYATTTSVAGTTTMRIAGNEHQPTYTSLGCTSEGGTFNVQIGDGSASSTMHTSSTGNTTSFTTQSSNNSFSMGEVLYISFGTPSATTIKSLSCTLMYREAD